MLASILLFNLLHLLPLKSFVKPNQMMHHIVLGLVLRAQNIEYLCPSRSPSDISYFIYINGLVMTATM